MRRGLVKAPRVKLHRDRNAINFGKQGMHPTCESCGADFAIKRSTAYYLTKNAHMAGSTISLLCSPCRKKSAAEVSKAKISLAKVADLEKAIAVLEKSGRLKAAEILKKQLVEAKRG